MAVPKKKTSTSKRNQRRSHHALKMTNIVEDRESGNLKRSHHISLKDGTYNGRQVITPKEDSVSAN